MEAKLNSNDQIFNGTLFDAPGFHLLSTLAQNIRKQISHFIDLFVKFKKLDSVMYIN